MRSESRLIAAFCLAMMAAFSLSSAAFATVSSVTLNSPSNNLWTSNATVTFTFTPTYSGTAVNASIWGTWGGGWSQKQANTSALAASGSSNTIQISSFPEGSGFLWNAQVCDSDNCAFAASNNTLNVDRTAPTLTQNVANNANFTTTSVTLNWTATDALDSSMACDLFVDGSAHVDNPIASANNTATTKAVTVTQGQHNWSVNCKDEANNQINSSTRTFGSYPELTVTTITWTSTDANHPKANSNITVSVTIKNDGSYNLATTYNASLYFDNAFVQKKTGTALLAGANETLNFDPITSGVTLGVHTIRVDVDVDNQVAEANESNQFTKKIAVGYNVSLVSLTPSSAKPGQSMALNVSVQFGNGDPVTDLSMQNFTIKDNYSGETLQTWSSSNNTYNSTFSSTQAASGFYQFNITAFNITFGDPRPGIHNLSINASRFDSSYWGVSDEVATTYNLTAPKLSIAYTGFQSGNENTTQVVTISVQNTGNIDTTSVSASLQKSSNIDFLNSTCTTISTLVAGGSSSNICPNLGVALKIVNANEQGWLYTTVSGNTSDGTIFSNTYNYSITITNTETTTEATSTTGNATCSTDSECALAYFCSSSICRALNCEADEKIVNHRCVKKITLAFPTYPQSVEILQGENKNISITVRNDGPDNATDTSLSFEGFNSSWYNITPSSQSINVGGTANFTADLTIPKDATIGNYSVKIVAASGSSKSFINATFIVLPTNETKELINKNLVALEANISQASKEIEVLLRTSNDTTLTQANATLTQIKQLLADAKAAAAAGDYATAQAKIKQIETLLAQSPKVLQEALSGVKGLPIPVWIWAVIAGVGVAAALGVFAHPKIRPYSAPIRQQLQKIKQHAKRAHEKWKEQAKKLKEKTRKSEKKEETKELSVPAEAPSTSHTYTYSESAIVGYATHSQTKAHEEKREKREKRD